jgi:hypothetical protein
MSSLDHIRSYYESLNTGDVDLVASHFTDDATHYYTRLGPHEGARAIAENARWGVDHVAGQWWMERGIESPSRYLLLVEWETLEAHNEGFRTSAGYEEWKALLHHFYDPFPTVEHYGTVTSA